MVPVYGEEGHSHVEVPVLVVDGGEVGVLEVLAGVAEEPDLHRAVVQTMAPAGISPLSRPFLWTET